MEAVARHTVSASIHSDCTEFQDYTSGVLAVDHGEHLIITSIKTCWAFSVVGVVEGIVQIRTGSLIPLSVQQLVDCNDKGDNCSGGNIWTAFDYIICAGSLATDSSYSYDGSGRTCQPYEPTVEISGYEKVPPNNKKTLMEVVAWSSLSANINSDCTEFQDYTSNVLAVDRGNIAL
ncbi:Senescence-specific cysteine protease SAG12 [Striga hermonthica]|uniref:Senescence-specific cysteine protease SAG12 n=1 Tax=Striga hermonthica TaxID=68872 RepID=A0A9N7RE00_STRHE|nr:Senescence-specific cysteine protease SAG12 [Striga hermonthica]